MADTQYTQQAHLAAGLGQLIAPRAVYYYDKYRLFRGLIGDQYRYLVPEGMASVKTRQLDYLTIAAHTEAVGQDNETFSYNNTYAGRTLTPSIHSCNIKTGVESLSSGAVDFVEDFAEAAMAAYTAYEDSGAVGFAAQYVEVPTTTPDHLLGANGTPLSAPLIRQAWSLLKTAGGRLPFYYCVDPIHVEELMRDGEMKQALQNTRTAGITAGITRGVQADRYLGEYMGIQIYCCDAMIENTGLFSLMFAQGALGQAYKMFPASYTGTTPQEWLFDVWKDGHAIGWRITFAAYMKVDGLVASGTADNNFMVTIAS